MTRHSNPCGMSYMLKLFCHPSIPCFWPLSLAPDRNNGAWYPLVILLYRILMTCWSCYICRYIRFNGESPLFMAQNLLKIDMLISVFSQYSLRSITRQWGLSRRLIFVGLASYINLGELCFETLNRTWFLGSYLEWTCRIGSLLLCNSSVIWFDSVVGTV